MSPEDVPGDLRLVVGHRRPRYGRHAAYLFPWARYGSDDWSPDDPWQPSPSPWLALGSLFLFCLAASLTGVIFARFG